MKKADNIQILNIIHNRKDFALRQKNPDIYNCRIANATG